jgi:flagellar biosynthesis/type III secretory pathway protein FliH
MLRKPVSPLAPVAGFSLPPDPRPEEESFDESDSAQEFLFEPGYAQEQEAFFQQESDSYEETGEETEPELLPGMGLAPDPRVFPEPEEEPEAFMEPEPEPEPEPEALPEPELEPEPEAETLPEPEAPKEPAIEESQETGYEPEPWPAPDFGPPPWQAELEAAQERARTIMDSANRYSVKMRELLLKQAEETLESARQEGYRQGYQEGRQKAMDENREALSQLVGAVKELDRGREELFSKYEQGMVDLSLDIARKVISNQLQKNDKAFQSIFQKAAEGLHGQKIVRLSISGHEAQFVTSHSDYLLSLIHGAEQLEVQVLEDEPPGTCILETEDTLIDASADKQLSKVIEAVQSVR